MRRQQLSIVELHKIDLLRNPKLQQDQVMLMTTIDRAKLKKMLKQTIAVNPRFERYIAKHNLLEIRSDGLLELLNRALFDDVVMQGFVTLFDKAEEAKMAELEKENTRIQDELSNW
jgi:tRNA U34 5-carboxymethylaminomethyl modifying enzyme MnmG/GidA